MRWLIVLLVLLLSGEVLAEEAPIIDDGLPSQAHRYVRDEPPGEDQIQVLRKGEPAPYSGHLFDEPTAIRWANWVIQYQELMQIYEDRSRRDCRAQTDYLGSILDIERARMKALEESAVASLKASEDARVKAEYKLAHPSFFKTPEFGFAIGVLSTTAVVLVVNAVSN